jgi:hypothetical protein
MSSSKFAAPLVLDIRPSLPIAAVLLTMHVLSGVAALVLPLPWWLRAALVAPIVASVVHTVRNHALLRDNRAVVSLCWGVDDAWTLTTRAGDAIDATLLPGSYLHPLLAVLNFRAADRRRMSVVIIPARVDAERFRQLRIRLSLTRSSAE